MTFFRALRLNRLQRIVVAIYFLSLAYCFVWVPWSVTTSTRYGSNRQRLGYGWVWAGPRYYQPQPLKAGTTEQVLNFSDIDGFVKTEAEEETARRRWDETSSYAVPDLILIPFRLVAFTAVAAAAFLLASLAKNPATNHGNPASR
ncbi:MAG TPA: hypothetical protein VI386_15265 [Candidatus Sulfotelmatobacter sp.]